MNIIFLNNKCLLPPENPLAPENHVNQIKFATNLPTVAVTSLESLLPESRLAPRSRLVLGSLLLESRLAPGSRLVLGSLLPESRLAPGSRLVLGSLLPESRLALGNRLALENRLLPEMTQ